MRHDTPSGLKRSSQDAVEVRLWEVYVARSRNNLYSTLSAYSLEKGPLQKNLQDRDRISFRFMAYDWERTIMSMLTRNGIPFEVVRRFQIDVVDHMMKKKIYIAEDDLDILFTLKTMLEEAGYDVLLSHCGNPMMEKNLPATDVFIIDKRMPDVDGIEVCRHLRAQPATRNTPVIMISASRNFSEQARAAGVNDILEKPFEMTDLLNLVSKYATTQPRDYADASQ
jgi:CheY-like chemotaxis protein